jgi:alkanesulfonate monooxygenase SsuD/methylene tetrahydromethanopterin reductase-like flavin-dependent oxidoreductase (luciferase family)
VVARCPDQVQFSFFGRNTSDGPTSLTHGHAHCRRCDRGPGSERLWFRLPDHPCRQHHLGGVVRFAVRLDDRGGEFVTDEICDRFCVLGTVEQAKAKLRELEAVGVDQFNVYLMTEGQETTLETYGREIIPRFAEVTGGAA